MQKTPARRKPEKAPEKRATLTLQQKVEKWFLPFLFVVTGTILVGTFVNAFLSHAK